jgi:predicted transcriptional regulator
VSTSALLTLISRTNSISHVILQAEQLGIVPVEPRLGTLGLAAKSMVRDNAGRLIQILTVNSTRVLPGRSSVEMMEVNMNL